MRGRSSRISCDVDGLVAEDLDQRVGEDVPAEHLGRALRAYRPACPVTSSATRSMADGSEPRVREGGQVLRVGQRQAVVDRAEEVARRLPLLADHRVRRGTGCRRPARRPSRIRSVLPAVSPRVALVATGQIRPERPAGLGVPGGGGEPAQQHRDVGALGAVVGVELVDDDVAEVGVPPQRQVVGALQQQVEHLVVGDQDVRRVPADVGPLGQHPG